jgi:predicted RNase H-like HicB family nuclease
LVGHKCRPLADAADAAPNWRIATALGENEVSMKYKVALKKSKEGYSVSCPGLPGCWSQGKTEDEALENIQDAIREYLEAIVKISKGAEVREVEVSL